MSDDDLLPWRPPLRSTGRRSFPARSKASMRGFLLARLPAEDRPRQIIYESMLERHTALCLLARPDLWNLWNQPSAVSWTDAQGRTAHHIFDYLAEFRDGFRLAVAVKSEARVERIGFRQTLARIRAGLLPGFADEVVLVTEQDLPAARVCNAERLHMFRMQPDAEADRIVADTLGLISLPLTVAEVVRESDLGGRGFRAVFRAIYAGQVSADTSTRITAATRLCRSGGDR